MIFGLFVAYLVALTGIGYAINWLLLPLFGRWWRLFVAPGVIVHELAHALGCVVTGAKVVEINFWKASGGHVIHTQPRLALIGPVVIAFAPTLVMTAGLFFVAPLISTLTTEVAWVVRPPSTVGELVGGYFGSLWTFLTSLRWLDWTTWLGLYGMLNVAVTIAPSRIDLDNTKWAFVGLLILTALVGRVLAIDVPVALVWPSAATSLLFLGGALVVVLVARAVGLFFLTSPRR